MSLASCASGAPLASLPSPTVYFSSCLDVFDSAQTLFGARRILKVLVVLLTQVVEPDSPFFQNRRKS